MEKFSYCGTIERCKLAIIKLVLRICRRFLLRTGVYKLYGTQGLLTENMIARECPVIRETRRHSRW